MLSDHQGTCKKNFSPILNRDLAWECVESDTQVSIAHFKIHAIVAISKAVAKPIQLSKPIVNRLQQVWLNN